MKIWFFMFIPLCLFITGCPLLNPIIRDIIVLNSSDYDVENLSFTYFHGTTGEQIVHIELLRSGEERTLSVETQEARFASAVTSVFIEYHINGVKRDGNNERDVFRDEYGNIISGEGRLGPGLNSRFVIFNEYHTVELIWLR